MAKSRRRCRLRACKLWNAKGRGRPPYPPNWPNGMVDEAAGPRAMHTSRGRRNSAKDPVIIGRSATVSPKAVSRTEWQAGPAGTCDRRRNCGILTARMTRPGRRGLALFFIVGLLALWPVAASGTSEADVERAEQARKEAYDRLVEVNAELEQALIDYNAINAELEELNYRIELIIERISDHEEQVVELRSRAEELVTEAYMSAGSDIFQIAFEADNIQDLLTSQVLIDRAADADLVDLNRLDAVRREMDRLREEVKADQERVEELRVDAADVVTRLDELQRERAAEYDRSDAAAREARVAFEEAERRRKLEEAARRQGAAGGVGVISGFVCPVPGASFINDWGFPRSGGRSHQGTDMFAPRGTPVVAVGNGTVTLKSTGLGGISVYLYTASAMYYYTHLNGYADGIASGQQVGAGQVVAYVGNTGNAIGASPHLHFQIHPGGGAPVNPFPTLAAAC